MKKKKKKYSLTAKERKENRVYSNPNRELTEQEKSQIEAANQKAKQRKKKIFRITALVLVLIIAITSLSIGITLAIQKATLMGAFNVDNTKENPIATIYLSNGEKIRMTLLYIENTPKADSEGKINYGSSTDGRGAVANFIYLAENGFFNDTIFSNNALGYLAFEGYTSATTHKGQDANYVSRLKGFDKGLDNEVSPTWNSKNFKLGYRIKRTTTVAPSTLNKVGYMAMIAGDSRYISSTTGFVMLTNNNTQFNMKIKDDSTENRDFTSTLSYMAKVADAESLAVMQRIEGMETENNQKVLNWRIPTEVRIKSIKVTNLNRKLRKNILNNFADYVLNTKSESDTAIKALKTQEPKSNFYPG